MLTLYTIPGSCSTGIHALMNALDMPFEMRKRDEVDNYQLQVPTNQVPALQDGEHLLTEGAAIALYLMEKNQIDIQQYGGTTYFYQWLMFCYATLHPAYGKMFAALRDMQEGPAREAYLQVLANNTSSLWQIVNTRLDGRDFTCGNAPCIVDYLLAVYANWGNAFPSHSIKLGENVIQLVKRISELPEFTAAYHREGASHSIPNSGF